MNRNYDYSKHGTMTHPGSMQAMIQTIPADIPVIVSLTQNLCLHRHWAKSYGITPSSLKEADVFIRSFEDKLKRLESYGYHSIHTPIPNQDKLFGICRDFTVIMTALCREAGIPARERCGFATYLESGKYIDHWVCEYWDFEQKKWIRVDAQLDALQKQALDFSFDSLNLPESAFITGADAWKKCREEQLDSALFGIYTWWGYDYLRCNLLLDANALLKMPMHPWDVWDGYKKCRSANGRMMIMLQWTPLQRMSSTVITTMSVSMIILWGML